MSWFPGDLVQFSEHDLIADQDTYTYESTISTIKIKFPGQPRASVRRETSGESEAVIYEGDDQTYELKISKVKNQSDITANGPDVEDKLIESFIKSKNAHEQGLERGDWKIKKYKGKTVIFSSPGRYFHYRVVIIDDLVVQLISHAYTGLVSEYDQKKADKFFGSLKLK